MKKNKGKELPEGTPLPPGRFYFKPNYPSDKFESGLMHEYVNVFQALKYQPVTLLEIGVAEGGSINYFADYFEHPKSRMIGMDYQRPLRSEPEFRKNVRFVIGDQNNAQRLNVIGKKFGPFDIIIDDGAHTLKETESTYENLFKYVKRGGYFIIEDWSAELLDGEKYAGMIDLMLKIYRENFGISKEMTLKLGYNHSYLLIRKL